MKSIRSRAALAVFSLVVPALLAGCDRGTTRALASEAFGKQSTELSTGITIAYVEAGDPAGEAVILLHGFTDTGRSFYPTMRHLLALRPDLHLFALDQRGHGESSMPDPETCRHAPERCFRPADLAADVVAFMDLQGISRAYLVGHSMGGLVAQEVALTQPERVERLVLIATWANMKDHPIVGEFLLPGLIEGPWEERLVQQGYAFPEDIYELTPVEADPEAEAWMAANWVTEPLADPAFLAEVLPETLRIKLGTWLGASRALLATDNRERLKELAVPTFVISGTQDGMVTESDEETLLASLDAAARSCKTRFVLKRYGRKPLPSSGLPEGGIAHNVQWGAGKEVAIDLAAYLREDGQPTRDLYYADPRNVRRVLTAPGEATLIEGGTPDCVEPDIRAQSDQGSVPLYADLGDHTYTITTAVSLAQRYFDQGLRLYYAFNHAEAIRAFDEAARLDPRCAMCFWGTALSYGPNINMPMDSASGVAAYEAIQKAQAVAEGAVETERALIQALAQRYAPVPPADRAALDSAYARALKRVTERYPEDPEAATLYAESLMDLSPWYYWNRDGSPRPQTRELLARLERVMASYPDHPGANHFYIHAVEAVDPERAVAAAERLAGLMPGAGHLVHMPGHIYVRVGRYLDAIKANEHAVHADETYIQDQKPAFGVYVAGYYPHNYDFMAFAASMIGRSEQAIGAAEKMETLAPQELLRAPGLTFLQAHQTRHLQFKVRFARWDDILEASAPAEDLPHARGIWHYARGRALAAKGDVKAAEEQLAKLRAIAADPAMAELRLEFNTSGAVLGIASEVLAGHVASARGDTQGAIDHLREAARLEDELVYGEPPEWSVPVRQELGRILLAAGRAAEAEQAFREDLERFPDNGWSLRGLARALEAQGRDSEAESALARFKVIWASADIQISSLDL